MKISVFTDEINREDPVRAVQLAKQWNVDFVEVRSLPGGRFPEGPDTELRDFFKMVDDAGLQISGVSPGFCKCASDDPSVATVLAEGLPRACEWARRAGTDRVICFGFKRDDSPQVPQAAIDRVAEMADIAGRHECRLVLENEPICWGGTGLEAAGMIRQIGADRLTLCWDPSNSARAGSAVPYPAEYDQIKDLVSHVHLKNYDPQQNCWSLIEQGVVDWPGQLAGLADDGYTGYVVVETHLSVSPDAFEFVDTDLAGLENNTRRNLQYVQSLLSNG